MTKNEMIAEVRAYLEHVSFACDCFVAYRSILMSIETYNKQINFAPGFFTLAKHTLSKCMCVELAKLYVGSGKEKTVRNLINQVKANYNLFSKKYEINYETSDDICCGSKREVIKFNIRGIIDDAERTLDEMQPVIKQLRGRRDQYLAHNDPQFFYGEVNPALEFPFTMDDAEKMIQFCGEFCNKLLLNLEGRAICYKTQNADDLQSLLRRL